MSGGKRPENLHCSSPLLSRNVVHVRQIRLFEHASRKCLQPGVSAWRTILQRGSRKLLKPTVPGKFRATDKDSPHFNHPLEEIARRFIWSLI